MREKIMLHKAILCSLLILLPLGGQAIAAKYAYMIDHGTPGVVASESKMARLVLKANGDCAAIPYEVITDGVKSITGTMNLSKALSMPLDMTTVTLSCSDQGVTAKVEN